MRIDRTQTPQQDQQQQPAPRADRPVTVADIIDRLSRFSGPPEDFLVNMLYAQCLIAAAEGGAIIRGGSAQEGGSFQILAVYPPLTEGAAAPLWLAQAVESAPAVFASGTTEIRPVHEPEDLYGQAARRHLVLVPIRGDTGVRGLEAFVVETRDAGVLAVCRERLEISSSLLSLYEMRLTLQHRQLDMRRLRTAMETLAAVNEHDRFAGAAMAFCNEVASRWQASRVGLGFLRGRYVHLRGLSHTEKFSRKMKLVQEIEAAMEECLDQDIEVIYPPVPEAAYVSRAAADLSAHQGPSAIVSMPLRRAGEVVGVLIIERPADRPFALEELEPLRLATDLNTARLANLNEHDRWFGVRAAAAVRKAMAGFLGPKHTWIKLIAIGVVALVLLLTFGRGDYNIEGASVIQPVERRVIPAPFEGRLQDVLVMPGDRVEKGTLLAQLDVSKLVSTLESKKAERLGAVKRADQARRDGKLGDMVIAQAEADKVTADIDLVNLRIKEGSVVAPITGTIVSGEDLHRQIGRTFELGVVLFEVAPLEELRAELSVPEDQVGDLVLAYDEARKQGKDLRGELAGGQHPEIRVPFVVERVYPMAEMVSQKNVFKVRVRLEKVHSWMLPGMEGIAKVQIGRRSFGWLWTRQLINWVRMKLWM